MFLGPDAVLVTLDSSLVAQLVKNPPAMQETWVRSLGWEDPPEEGMATHSRVLAWRTPWKEDPGGLQSIGSQRVRHMAEWLSTELSLLLTIVRNSCHFPVNFAP